MKKLLLLCLSALLICSCSNVKSASEVEFTDDHETATYQGKPYTGKVSFSKEEMANDKEFAPMKEIIDECTLTYEEGKIVDMACEFVNGYKCQASLNLDGKNDKFYDDKGNAITKDKFQEMLLGLIFSK